MGMSSEPLRRNQPYECLRGAGCLIPFSASDTAANSTDPGNAMGSAQASDAEQGIEDLTVDLEPYLGWTVDVAAAGVAHRGRGADEDQEQHAAPRDDVEAVDGDEEAEGRDDEFTECFESDLDRFPGAVFGGELVAVGVGLPGRGARAAMSHSDQLCREGRGDCLMLFDSERRAAQRWQSF